MTRSSVLIALALSACVYDPGVTPMEAPEGTWVAVEIARMALARVHGPLPRYAGEIIWTSDDCVPHGDGDCTAGGYHTYTEAIYLADRGAIWRSELTHELVHFYLDLEGDGDGGHSQRDWWDMVDAVDEEVRAWEEHARCPAARRLEP